MRRRCTLPAPTLPNVALFPPYFMRQVLAAVAVLVVLTALACSDQLAPPPPKGFNLGHPLFSVADMNATLGTDSHDAHASPVSLGTTIGPTVATVTISGSLTLKWTQASGYPSGSVAGTFTPSGRWTTNGCVDGGQVAISGPAGVEVSPCDNADPYTTQHTFVGSYTAGRSKDYLVQRWGYCGYPAYGWPADCVTYSGSQTISVKRLTADLSLTASPTTAVQPGTSITYTAAATPETIGNPAVLTPFSITQWVYADSAGTHGCTSVTATTCTITANTSGTVTVTAVVNGEQQTRTMSVTVVPCPTGDPILDSAAVRKGLDSLWKLSNPTDPVTANRHERSMNVYDSAGVTVIRIEPFDPTTDGPCENMLKRDVPPPGTLKAQIHTHPAHVSETLECKPGFKKRYANQFGGPSPADWASATQDPPKYVLDADNTYRHAGYPFNTSDRRYWTPELDPVTHLPKVDPATGDTTFAPAGTAWRSYYKKEPRKQGSCIRY